jgi:hypothetical protein
MKGKILSILIAVLLLAIAFSGCTQQKENDETGGGQQDTRESVFFTLNPIADLTTEWRSECDNHSECLSKSDGYVYLFREDAWQKKEDTFRVEDIPEDYNSSKTVKHTWIHIITKGEEVTYGYDINGFRQSSWTSHNSEFTQYTWNSSTYLNSWDDFENNFSIYIWVSMSYYDTYCSQLWLEIECI